MRGCEIETNTTIVKFEAKDIIEAYRAMFVMIELALQTKFCEGGKANGGIHSKEICDDDCDNLHHFDAYVLPDACDPWITI